MMPPEVDGCMEHAKSLFPRWEPGDEERAIWERFFAAEPNAGAVKRALGKVYESSRYLQPKLVAVREALVQFRPSAEQPQAAGSDYSGVWAINRANSIDMIPMVYKRGKIPPPHIVHQHAEEVAKMRQEQRGGDWVVVAEAETQWDARAAVDPAFAAELERRRAQHEENET